MNRNEVYQHKLLQIVISKDDYLIKLDRIMVLKSVIFQDLMLSNSDVHELYILCNFEISELFKEGTQ